MMGLGVLIWELAGGMGVTALEFAGCITVENVQPLEIHSGVHRISEVHPGRLPNMVKLVNV
jgi:hypothetical protein